MDLSSRVITSIKCIAIVKQSKSSKNDLYALHVIWSSGVIYVIRRSYSAFFELQTCLKNELKENKLDVSLPVLPDLPKLFPRKNSKNEKRRKDIEKYCEQLLELPANFAVSSSIKDFFEPWKDECDPIIIDPDDLVSSAQNTENDSSESDKTTQETTMCDNGTTSEKSCSGNGLVIKKTYPHLVLQNYDKLNESDIALITGSIVDVLEKNNTGWWFVFDHERSSLGWAPGAFLQQISHPISPNDPQTPNTTKSLEKEDIEYQVTKDFTARHSNEITLKKNDVVDVVKISLDGWWIVRCGNSTGFFPAVLLEKKTDIKDASTRFKRKSLNRKTLPPRSPGRDTEYENIDFTSINTTDDVVATDAASIEEDKLDRNASISSRMSTVNQHHPLYRLLSDDQLLSANDTHPKAKLSSDSSYSSLSNMFSESSPEFKDDEVKYTEVIVTKPRSENSGNVDNENTVYAEICKLKSREDDEVSTKSREDDEVFIYDNASKLKKASHVSGVTDNYTKVVKKKLSADTAPALYDKVSLKYDGKKSPLHENCDEKETESDQKEWLFGAMNREECEKMLSLGVEGDFIIRRSTKDDKNYCLSVLFYATVRHFEIKKTLNGNHRIGKHDFSDLPTIVKFYQTNPLFYDSSNNPVCLKKSS